MKHIAESVDEETQSEVRGQDGTIALLPTAVYPAKHIKDLKKESDDIKAKIASGEQPAYDSANALFDSMEK